MVGGSQPHAASNGRSVFCYLGTRELGVTGRELSRPFGLTPAAIHDAVVRGERFLKENEEVREGLLKDFKDLKTSPLTGERFRVLLKSSSDGGNVGARKTTAEDRPLTVW
jgi:hypothetical protein